MLKGILIPDVDFGSYSGNTIHIINLASCLATFSEIKISPLRFHVPLVGSAIHAMKAVSELLYHRIHYVWMRHAISPLLIHLASAKRVTSICDINTLIEAQDRMDCAHGFMSKLHQKIEFRNLAGSDIVRVHNNKLKDYFVSKYLGRIRNIEDKIRVIPIPLNVAEYPFKESYGSSSVSLVYIGGSQVWQGIPDLVKAFSKLRLAEARLVFYVRTLPQAITSLIKELGMGDRTKLEFLPHHDLINVLPSYDAFVIPRPSNELANTCTPIKLVEAMACGLPIIATDVGGISEYIQHKKNGYLVDPGSSEALAEGIAKVIENPKLARKMGENARQFADETFDLPVISQQIKSILETENFHMEPDKKGTMANPFLGSLVP